MAACAHLCVCVCVCVREMVADGAHWAHAAHPEPLLTTPNMLPSTAETHTHTHTRLYRAGGRKTDRQTERKGGGDLKDELRQRGKKDGMK